MTADQFGCLILAVIVLVITVYGARWLARPVERVPGPARLGPARSNVYVFHDAAPPFDWSDVDELA